MASIIISNRTSNLLYELELSAHAIAMETLWLDFSLCFAPDVVLFSPVSPRESQMPGSLKREGDAGVSDVLVYAGVNCLF